MGSRYNGTIAIELDDAKEGTYTKAFPEFKSRGLSFGIACPPDKIGNSVRCTWSEPAEMNAHGAEIASHGGGQGTDLPDADADADDQ
jgi:peptidoglycan/xylan/chitin deacetylase (PgdA/CDA1 family)